MALITKIIKLAILVTMYVSTTCISTTTATAASNIIMIVIFPISSYNVVIHTWFAGCVVTCNSINLFVYFVVLKIRI